MNNLKFFALCVSVSLIASACFEVPKANTSRSSTTTTQTSTPTADKSAAPSSPAAQNSPAKAASYDQALSDYNAKNYEKAEAGFKEVLQTEPNNANAHYYLGSIYYLNRKDYEKSLSHFEQAAKIDYKSTDKLMALGENQRALKQFDRAIVQYGKVIGFEPNNADAYYGLGLTYIGLNNKIGARQQLQKLEPLNKSLAEKLSKEIDGMK